LNREFLHVFAPWNGSSSNLAISCGLSSPPTGPSGSPVMQSPCIHLNCSHQPLCSLPPVLGSMNCITTATRHFSLNSRFAACRVRFRSRNTSGKRTKNIPRYNSASEVNPHQVVGANNQNANFPKGNPKVAATHRYASPITTPIEMVVKG